MCKECEHKHKLGYRCPCECHQVIDRRIAERDKLKQRKDVKVK